ncbi:hypothetical protein Sste5344_007818 [Sporothrix stenoceras]
MDTANSAQEPSPANSAQPAKKRRRLNFACEGCRTRKVRCDQLQPACHNCLSRGTPCVTVDKRRPGVAVQRHEAGRPSTASSPAADSSVLSVAPADTTRDVAAVAVATAGPTSVTPTVAGSATTGTNGPPNEGISTASRNVNVLSDEIHLSPDSHAEVNVDGTVRFSGRLPLFPQGGGRTSVELLTDWLNLAVHRLGLRHRIAPKSLLSGLSTPVEGPGISMLTTGNPPTLPPAADGHRLLSLYFRDVNSVFNLLDHDKTLASLDLLYTCGTDNFLHQHEHGLTSLLQLYFALSLGSLSCRESDQSAFRRDSVDFGQNLLGHVIGWNAIGAVQVLFLLALCLRAQDRIFLSWSTLGTCVVMAVSLGLNREPVTERRQAANLERQRTWWCIYSLEKLHAFELGMVSSIVDEDCSQPEPDPVETPQTSVLVSFAKCLSSISRQIVAVRNKEERAITEGAMIEKATTAGKTCLTLLTWAETVDDKFSLIMLSRNSMLLSPGVFQRYFECVGRDKPWCHLLEDRSAVAASAARRIISLLVENAETDSDLALLSIINPLHAAYVLMVQTINHPHSRRASLDIALLEQAHEFAILQYEKSNKDTKLHILLQMLMSFLTQYVGKDTTSPRSNGLDIMSPTSASVSQMASQGMGTMAPPSTGLSTESPAVPDWFGWNWPDFNELLSMDPPPV